jgi:hypothetical protein
VLAAAHSVRVPVAERAAARAGEFVEIETDEGHKGHAHSI